MGVLNFLSPSGARTRSKLNYCREKTRGTIGKLLRALEAAPAPDPSRVRKYTSALPVKMRFVLDLQERSSPQEFEANVDGCLPLPLSVDQLSALRDALARGISAEAQAQPGKPRVSDLTAIHDALVRALHRHGLDQSAALHDLLKAAIRETQTGGDRSRVARLYADAMRKAGELLRDTGNADACREVIIDALVDVEMRTEPARIEAFFGALESAELIALASRICQGAHEAPGRKLLRDMACVEVARRRQRAARGLSSAAGQLQHELETAYSDLRRADPVKFANAVIAAANYLQDYEACSALPAGAPEEVSEAEELGEQVLQSRASLELAGMELMGEPYAALHALAPASLEQLEDAFATLGIEAGPAVLTAETVRRHGEPLATLMRLAARVLDALSDPAVTLASAMSAMKYARLEAAEALGRNESHTTGFDAQMAQQVNAMPATQRVALDHLMLRPEFVQLSAGLQVVRRMPSMNRLPALHDQLNGLESGFSAVRSAARGRSSDEGEKRQKRKKAAAEVTTTLAGLDIETRDALKTVCGIEINRRGNVYIQWGVLEPRDWCVRAGRDWPKPLAEHDVSGPRASRKLQDEYRQFQHADTGGGLATLTRESAASRWASVQRFLRYVEAEAEAREVLEKTEADRPRAQALTLASSAAGAPSAEARSPRSAQEQETHTQIGRSLSYLAQPFQRDGLVKTMVATLPSKMPRKSSQHPQYRQVFQDHVARHLATFSTQQVAALVFNIENSYDLAESRPPAKTDKPDLHANAILVAARSQLHERLSADLAPVTPDHDAAEPLASILNEVAAPARPRPPEPLSPSSIRPERVLLAAATSEALKQGLVAEWLARRRVTEAEVKAALSNLADAELVALACGTPPSAPVRIAREVNAARAETLANAVVTAAEAASAMAARALLDPSLQASLGRKSAELAGRIRSYENYKFVLATFRMPAPAIDGKVLEARTRTRLHLTQADDVSRLRNEELRLTVQEIEARKRLRALGARDAKIPSTPSDDSIPPPPPDSDDDGGLPPPPPHSDDEEDISPSPDSEDDGDIPPPPGEGSPTQPGELERAAGDLIPDSGGFAQRAGRAPPMAITRVKAPHS